MSETATSRTALLPTYAELGELDAEIVRSVVPIEFQDENGHMNVRHYFDFGVAATGLVFDRLGIDDAYRSQRRRGFFTAEHHLRYFAEVRAGDAVSVYFAFVARSDKVAHGIAMMVDDTTATLVNALEVVVTHMNMDTRRVVPFDPDLSAKIDAEFDRTAQFRAALPVSGTLGVRRPVRVAHVAGRNSTS